MMEQPINGLVIIIDGERLIYNKKKEDDLVLEKVMYFITLKIRFYLSTDYMGLLLEFCWWEKKFYFYKRMM